MEAPGEDGIFTERVQYMFPAPSIAAVNKDRYANGGGPALLPNESRATLRRTDRAGHAPGRRQAPDGHLS